MLSGIYVYITFKNDMINAHYYNCKSQKKTLASLEKYIVLCLLQSASLINLPSCMTTSNTKVVLTSLLPSLTFSEATCCLKWSSLPQEGEPREGLVRPELSEQNLPGEGF